MLLFSLHYPLVPSSPPNNVAAQLSSSSPTSSILVSWEEVPPIEQNGVIVTYELLYEPLTTFGIEDRPTRLNVPASMRATTISGLHEYVEYNFSLRAFTSVGPGPYSTPITVTTGEAGKSFACRKVYK